MGIFKGMWHRRSLQFKWSLAMGALGACFFALLAWAAFCGFRRFVVDLNREETQVVADMITQRIHTEMKHLREDLIFFVSSNARIAASLRSAGDAYADKTEEDIKKEFARVDQEWPGQEWEVLRRRYLDDELSLICEELRRLARLPVVELFITDRRGAVVASTNKTTDYYQADEEWWQRAFNGGLGSVHRTELEYDESSQAQAWALAAPVFDEDGDVQGVIKVVVDKIASFRFLLGTFLGKGAYVGLLRSDGEDIFSLGFEKARDMSFLSPLGRAVLAREGHKRFLIETPEGRRFIAGWARLDAGLLSQKYDVFVYCLKDYQAALGAFNRMSRWFFVLWGVATLVFWFFASLLARRFLAPLWQLKQGFEFLKRGFLRYRLSIRSGDEIEELAEDFNRTIEELRKNTVSRNYFDEIIQQMSDILIVTDGRGNIQTANRRACEVLEYGDTGLVGKPMADIVSRSDRYIINWGLKGAIEQGALKDKKVTFLSRSGRGIPVYLGTRSLRDHDNNLVGLVCVAKDLTEMSQLLEALKKSNQEIMRQKEELEKGLREQHEMRDAMLSVLEDTTESKRSLEATLQKLRETQGQLLQAEKMVSLGQIAAGVAHEINNPLFVISGEAEILTARKNVPPEVRDFLRIVRDQVERINDVIKRLLEFSRKRETTRTVVDVNALVARSADLLEYQARAHGKIDMRLELASEPLPVRGDANQLVEVFVNVMINAVQAMEGQGGTLTVMTFCDIIRPPLSDEGAGLEKPVLKPEAPYVHVQIIDTGSGMPSEVLKKVFDPFFTTKKTGTGLGLSVCYGIVENHGGDIVAESRSGQGTTFTVRLPLYEAREEKMKDD